MHAVRPAPASSHAHAPAVATPVYQPRRQAPIGTCARMAAPAPLATARAPRQPRQPQHARQPLDPLEHVPRRAQPVQLAATHPPGYSTQCSTSSGSPAPGFAPAARAWNTRYELAHAALLADLARLGDDEAARRLRIEAHDELLYRWRWEAEVHRPRGAVARL